MLINENISVSQKSLGKFSFIINKHFQTVVQTVDVSFGIHKFNLRPELKLFLGFQVFIP